MSDSLQAIPPRSQQSMPSTARGWNGPSSGPASGRVWRGGTVLLDLNIGRYDTPNRWGSIIWEHCIGHSTISDIHAVSCDRFEVAFERTQDDLVVLVHHLV